MKKCRLKDIMYWLFAFGPVILTLAFYSFLPNEVPLHYNFDGVVDRVSSKTEFLIFSLILTILTLSFRLLLLIGKNEPNHKKNKEVMICIFSFVGLIYTSIILFFLLAAVDSKFFDEFDLFSTLAMLFSMFLVFIGYLLPRMKRNKMMGIRIPWTLKNDLVWDKTHLFGSKVFIFGGLISTVIAFFTTGLISLYFVLGALVLMTILCIIYAYLIDKKSVNKV